MIIVFTKHARERFTERWSAKNPKSTGSIRDIFDLAVEDRSIFNDHQTMIYFWERYGYDKKYHFWVYRDMVFVGVESIDQRTGKPSIDMVTVIVREPDKLYARIQQKTTWKEKGQPKEQSVSAVSHRKASRRLCHSGSA